MADGEYTVKVTTTADPAGAQIVAKSIDTIGKSAHEAGTETKSLGADMASLGSRQNATKDVIEGLDMAMKGQTASIFGVAKAAKNLWEVLTVSTPMGRLAQLAIIAAGAFNLFRERVSGGGEAAKAAGPEITNAFGQAERAIEKLNSLKLDSLKAELDSIKDSFSFAEKFAAKLDAIEKQRRDARMNLELATLAADPSIGPEEKKAREFGIRDRYATEDAKAKKAERANAETLAQNKAIELADAAAKAEAASDAQQRRVDAGRAAPTDLAKQIEDYKKQLADLQKKAGGTSAEANARGDLMQMIAKRIAELEQYQTARTSAAGSEGAKRDAEAQVKFLADLRAKADEAKKSAEDAQRAFEQLRALNSLDNTNDPIKQGVDRAAGRKNAGVPEPASNISTSPGPALSAPPSIKIGDKIYDAASRIGERSIEIDGVARAVERLSGAIESKIEIDGRKFNDITKRLDAAEAVVRASNRGN